jgi:hypothetical protein
MLAIESSSDCSINGTTIFMPEEAAELIDTRVTLG